jgi:predicted nucleic acid-binding protein
MRRVFWDSMLFVYLLERHAVFFDRMIEIRKGMLERQDKLFTSTLTLGELLAAPHFVQDSRLAAIYRSALSHPHVEMIPFTEETAEHFARIRSDRTVAPADAIQLACAAQAGVDLFLTNDKRLLRKVVPGINFIADLNFEYL